MAVAEPPSVVGKEQASRQAVAAPDVAQAGASSLALSDGSSQAQQALVANDGSARPVSQPLVAEVSAAAPAGLVLAQLGANTNPESPTLVAARSLVVEPLAQVATPRDSRRARLLAYSVNFDPHAADSSDAVRSRERITHRISDESIYDSITRLGLSGDRVSIKF
jgi:hypothetical protein